MFVGVLSMSIIGASMVYAYLALERRLLSWFYATGGKGLDEEVGST